MCFEICCGNLAESVGGVRGLAAEDDCRKQLFAQRPTHVVACQDWPGRALSCRDVSMLDLDSVRDWFAFLGLSRSGRN